MGLKDEMDKWEADRNRINEELDGLNFWKGVINASWISVVFYALLWLAWEWVGPFYLSLGIGGLLILAFGRLIWIRGR